MDVLVLIPATDNQKARLEAAAPGASFTYTNDSDVTDEQLSCADVIIGNISPARLPQAPKLQLLQLNSAGYDNYITAGTLAPQTKLCCSTGAYGQSVSEHLFAMLFAQMKRLPGYCAGQQAHAWEDLGPVRTLVDAQVLVLGAGNIGAHFAQLCKNMGAHTTGIKRNTSVCPAAFDRVATMDELEQLLPQADVVASFLPSMPATRGLADAHFFNLMKERSYFVNGGRGDLVDQAALAEALTGGHLAGASLDVTVPEPLPQNDPLWNVPNVFITPHISGWYHLPVTLEIIVDIAAENLAHLAAGEPLRNHVNA